jgi:hypothetical protein
MEMMLGFWHSWLSILSVGLAILPPLIHIFTTTGGCRVKKAAVPVPPSARSLCEKKGLFHKRKRVNKDKTGLTIKSKLCYMTKQYAALERSR